MGKSICFNRKGQGPAIGMAVIAVVILVSVVLYINTSQVSIGPESPLTQTLSETDLTIRP